MPFKAWAFLFKRMSNTSKVKTNPQDILVFCNIDKEDFTFKFDGNPYTIKAGDTRFFPRFLAGHGAKHLIDKILNRQEKKTSLDNLREELGNQIILGLADKYRPQAPKTLTQKVEELNPKEDDKEEFEGLKKEVEELPTKKELLKQAEAKGLTVDKKLEKMKVKDLMEMIKDL